MSARILVVDDEPQMGRLLKAGLSARGYQVIVATDGQIALDKAASWRPDVIVLDLGLPVVDGLEVCREIRGWSQVPIIVLTVRDAEQDKVAALDLGADATWSNHAATLSWWPVFAPSGAARAGPYTRSPWAD